MANKKPILVSGSPRSGTTWVGKIIQIAPNVRWVTEPFNTVIKRNYSPIKYIYEYINPDTEEKRQKEILKYLNLFYGFPPTHLLNRLIRIRSYNGFLNQYYDIKSRWKDRPLLKDPIAIMSAEWIFKKLNADIIITIRHPAAFVASMKVKGWTLDYKNLLMQESLMNDYLSNFREEIVDHTENKKDVISQAITLWNIVYSIVYQYQEKYGDVWHFIKHEDLSQNPISEFKKIFNKININFTEEVVNEINKSTNALVNTELDRNSIKNLKTWKARLHSDEIQMVKRKTQHVWNKFYDEKDWN